MSNSTEAIRAKIDAFLTDIQALTRAAALEAIHSALSGGATPARRGVGRVARPAAPVVRRIAKRAKRTTEDVAATGARILAFVKSNAGCSVEQIREGLGLSKKDVALPIVRLKAERKLKTTGQKRGTKYFAGGSATKTPKPVAPKAAKRVAPVAAKRRKPMAPAQKAALLERLANARAARAAKLARAK
ncbi:MAG: hypothetical protein K8S98_02335 [Planctomycetes bacterium]|nr:hypothetical protein [Planctomycetota bacterium]